MSSANLPKVAAVPEVDSISVKQRSRDDVALRIAALLLIVVVVVFCLLQPEMCRNAIQAARTFVTKYFSWYFVILGTAALVFCLGLAFSRFGSIRLGGEQAVPEYSRFAWYSMLFACGQGIGLIFWSVAEPIMVQHDDPLYKLSDKSVDGSMAWSYFHWAVTAWAIYCCVAVCFAYSVHNRKQRASFRGATEDLFSRSRRRPIGFIIELVAIITTVFGLATSFGFAALQFSAGVVSATGLTPSRTMKIIVILVIALLTGVSVFFGIERGMKRVSELNSILSIVLMVLVFTLGPTLYLLHLLPQTLGTYIDTFVQMSVYTDPTTAVSGLQSWSDSWVGIWTVFIWCWCFAFSPFVASFIASISRGRTVREFILGVISIPSLIVVVWICILGGTAIEYDRLENGAISKAVSSDASSGLFAMASFLPRGTILVVVVATILVATYFITSLDSGVHALSSFVSMSARPSAVFRAVLVTMIAAVSLILLVLGGDRALDTIQTGTIIGALPFTVIVIFMVVNLLRRLKQDRTAGLEPRSELG